MRAHEIRGKPLEVGGLHFQREDALAEVAVELLAQLDEVIVEFTDAAARGFVAVDAREAKAQQRALEVITGRRVQPRGLDRRKCLIGAAVEGYSVETAETSCTQVSAASLTGLSGWTSFAR
jgi:hypothetical protein